jgi:hypothetical protein
MHIDKGVQGEIEISPEWIKAKERMQVAEEILKEIEEQRLIGLKNL